MVIPELQIREQIRRFDENGSLPAPRLWLNPAVTDFFAFSNAADCPDVRIVNVLSDEPDWDGEKGFISREIIEKYSVPDSTYLFCGPYAMYGFVKKALEEMGVPARRFRQKVRQQRQFKRNRRGYERHSQRRPCL